ncbi:FKBP-type peptidyl-prolyl cis-trans isomerase [Tsukamurella strandjordii]|uniref:Peptidyl-prolyl cis-trans isomerase n=1 Tax=Tsukamurella strandjordii TaxID=147577 RepID=A0AA90SI25_9ACTN|nr:FKBP-type peptidyl-prolyl cis-trans isomerase [Tsukamurella strandjordii]MDP0399564.1 FKBP-type peptidyl-prolyl cis-trans isomerase [Tsukamurella strandjordii]
MVNARSARFAVAVAVPLLLVACGSPADTTSTAPAAARDPLATCPSEAPAADAKPTVVFEGDGGHGRANVVPPTKAAAPRVTVTTPFRVDRTQVLRVHGGSGPALSENAVVTVCYQGVNGRTGAVFDDSFARSASAEFALTDVVPGFRKAIAGQQVGSTVAAAITSADGYPQGQPAAQIDPGDTLIFTITVLGAS